MRRIKIRITAGMIGSDRSTIIEGPGFRLEIPEDFKILSLSELKGLHAETCEVIDRLESQKSKIPGQIKTIERAIQGATEVMAEQTAEFLSIRADVSEAREQKAMELPEPERTAFLNRTELPGTNLGVVPMAQAGKVLRSIITEVEEA